MSENTTETLIGAVVLAVAAGFLVYAGQVAGLPGSASNYPLVAEFRSIEGVNIGTDVKLAGVKVGIVTGIGLDRETYQARATLAIEKGIQVPDDSEARVSSDGLLGGAFIEIVPGASDVLLESGGEILNTQGAVSFLNLLLKFAGSGTNE